MSEAYEFTKLGEVEKLEEVPEGANAFIEVDGAVKRVPGDGLGGSGGAITPFFTFSGYDLYLDKNKATMATPYDVLKAMANGTAVVFIGSSTVPPFQAKHENCAGGPQKLLGFTYSGYVRDPLSMTFPTDTATYLCGVKGASLVAISNGSYTSAEWNAAAQQLLDEL